MAEGIKDKDSAAVIELLALQQVTRGKDCRYYDTSERRKEKKWKK